MQTSQTLQHRGPWVILGGSLAMAALMILWLWSPWARRAGGGNDPLVLYCAAGIAAPVEAVRSEYEAAFDTRVQVDFGGSGQLMNKIIAAPGHGDLFLSADLDHIEQLREHNPPLVREVIPICWHEPVLAFSTSGRSKVNSLDDLLRDDVKVVLANQSASIGQLAEELLTKSGHWPKLREQMRRFEAKVSLTGTVNEVAQTLQLGAADVGIIWDATAKQRGLPYLRPPEFEDARQQLHLAVLAGARNPTAALRFARYLTSRDKGQPHFAAHFYKPLDDADVWALRPRLTILSGAMLRPGIERTLAEFQQREGVDIDIAYNGCGVLVAQMRAGQRPDAYFSCDVTFMEQVQDLFETPTTITENDMVLMVPKGNSQVRSLDDLLKPGVQVGLAHPEKSALGALTVDLLRRTGHLESLRASGNIKLESATGDFLVNQVVVGALDAAIVYQSNALASADNLAESVDVYPIEVPGAFAAQPIAVGRSGNHKYLAERLLQALQSPESRRVMESVGFRWKDRQP